MLTHLQRRIFGWIYCPVKEIFFLIVLKSCLLYYALEALKLTLAEESHLFCIVLKKIYKKYNVLCKFMGCCIFIGLFETSSLAFGNIVHVDHRRLWNCFGIEVKTLIFLSLLIEALIRLASGFIETLILVLRSCWKSSLKKP